MDKVDKVVYMQYVQVDIDFIVPELIEYMIAVLTYNYILHETAPRYLGPLVRVFDLPGRCSLRSASMIV